VSESLHPEYKIIYAYSSRDTVKPNTLPGPTRFCIGLFYTIGLRKFSGQHGVKNWYWFANII